MATTNSNFAPAEVDQIISILKTRTALYNQLMRAMKKNDNIKM